MKSVTSGQILCEFMQTTLAYANEVMCCFGDGVRKLSDPSLLKEGVAKNRRTVQRLRCLRVLNVTGSSYVLRRSNDERSSRQICPRWRRRPACTSFRSRLPSSPHRQRSRCRYARTPEGRQSHPAETDKVFFYQLPLSS